MKILQMKVQNFRGIRNLCWTPGQHNVLIGQINSGKSTLLNAIGLVLDPDVGRRPQPITESDFIGMNVMEDGKPVSIDIEIVLGDMTEIEEREFLEYLEPWDRQTTRLLTEGPDASVYEDKERYSFAMRMAFRARFDPTEDAIQPVWHYPKFSYLTNDLDFRPCPRADREKVGFFLIPAEREAKHALSFTRHSALDKALRAEGVSLDTQLKGIVEEVRGKGLLLFGNPGFSDLISSVERQVSALLPLEASGKRPLFFDLSTMGHYDLMNILRAYIALADQDKPYPVSSQGTGTRQILVLSALRVLSSRRQRTIIALEEPETGLHPHMQKALLRDLMGTAQQTLVTTHSVHVAQTVNPESIYTVKNDSGSVSLVSAAVPKDLGEDTIRAVARVRNQSPGEVLNALFGPWILLVEGQGDREALPTLLRRLNSESPGKYVDPDRLGVTVIECLSKTNMPKVAPYYGRHLQKRVCALLDGDKKDEGTLENTRTQCDAVFCWPDRHAMEKILLLQASESTLSGFVNAVTEMGDEYFVRAGTATKAGDALREDVFSYLKRDKPNVRLFAEFLPVEEISTPVRHLAEVLFGITNGTPPEGVYRLGT